MVSRNGFGLVEVTVALTLLAVGLLGVAASALMAARLLRESQMMELAAFEAGQVLDSIARTPNPHGGQRESGVLSFTWTVSSSGGAAAIALAVTYSDGTRVRRDHFALDVKK